MSVAVVYCGIVLKLISSASACIDHFFVLHVGWWAAIIFAAELALNPVDQYCAAVSLLSYKTSLALPQAVEMLAHVVLNHVPVEGYCFRNKCVYMTHIVRRVLKTVIDRSLLDDKVSVSFPLHFYFPRTHTCTEGDLNDPYSHNAFTRIITGTSGWS
jgi:hypothetical protein